MAGAIWGLNYGCNLEFLPAGSRCHVYRFVCYLYWLKSLGNSRNKPLNAKVFSGSLRYVLVFFLGACCFKSNTPPDGCQTTTNAFDMEASFEMYAKQVFEVFNLPRAAMEGQEATGEDEDDVVRILILGQKDAMTL